jgi:class 3 adenylate cyclase
MPEPKIKPPTGTVTFLFTDIVGSTEMWEQHGDAFLPVLQAHNAILSDAMQRYGGFLVKTEGDSYKIAFSDASAAAKCAILAQAALQRYPWPHDVGPLKVRMGLHTGKPFMQGNDYFGPAINRAARILSAAHGGQILVSDETIRYAEGRMEVGTRFVDQGHHRLKDLSEPVRLYQVTHPALEQRNFPPPSSLNGHANNLPTQRRSFIGREKEIEQIASEFAGGDTRLLTVTGPAGSGKTRLSHQAAAEYAHLFPDGVWNVQLSNAVDVIGAAIEVADSLGIDLPPGAPPLETVQRWLANRSCLLILDDCGHVPQADRLIRELLSGSASLRCLATSRHPLPLAEQSEIALLEFTLPPENATTEQLMASEAGHLFVDRVHDERKDFAITDQRAGSIARLLKKLPAFPGPIEKAAELLGLNQVTIDAVTQEVAHRAGEMSHAAARKGRELLSRTKEMGTLLLSQATILADRNHLEEAEGKCREALAIYQRAEDDYGVAATLRQLGNIAFAKKQYAHSVTLLSAAHQAFHDLKSPEALAVRVDLEHARRAVGHDLPHSTMSIDQAIDSALAD